MVTGVGCLLLLPTAASPAPVDALLPSGSDAGAEMTMATDSRVSPAAPVTPAFRVTMGSPLTRPVLSTDQAVGEDIPEPARRAYMRAAVIMGDVARRCQIPWTLVAAVGRVESDHGRYGDAELDSKGVARPYVFGAALDGRGARPRVPDTDNGGLDRDRRWDRAVGPLQFIPSTWSVVGVDGDGDGTRSPHDIDDAALAASVYLCADSTHLTRPAHMRRALLRYNGSRPYAALVLAYERIYRTDELATVPPLVAMIAPASPWAAEAPRVASVRRLVMRAAQRPVRRDSTTRPEHSALRSVTKRAATSSAQPKILPTATRSPRPSVGPTRAPTTGVTTEPAASPTASPTAGAASTPPVPEPTTGPSTEPTPSPAPTPRPRSSPASGTSATPATAWRAPSWISAPRTRPSPPPVTTTATGSSRRTPQNSPASWAGPSRSPVSRTRPDWSS